MWEREGKCERKTPRRGSLCAGSKMQAVQAMAADGTPQAVGSVQQRDAFLTESQVTEYVRLCWFLFYSQGHLGF